MRKCVQNLPSGKETKTDANNKIKNNARRQENEQAPKNKTTKAEIIFFAHSIDPGPRQPHQRLRKKQAIGVSDGPCKTRSEIFCERKANDHNERKNNESIN
jgi:hypothetical protein